MRYELLLFITCSISSTWCAKILVLFPLRAFGHYTLGHRLAKELAHKGHQVTMMAPYKQDRNIENYTEIYLQGFHHAEKDKKNVLIEMEEMMPISQVITLYHLGYETSEKTLRHKSVSDLLRSNQTFDLVIMDLFLNEALAGIAYKLKAHIVYFAAHRASIWDNRLVANPTPLHIPHVFLDHQGSMCLCRKLHNLFLHVAEELYRRFIAYPCHDKLLHEVVPEAPSLDELLYKNDALVLVNSHVSTNNPVPSVPNVIEIGGFHVGKQKMSKKLRRFLDATTEGVMFFSLGSNVKTSFLDEEKRKCILKAFGKIKQKVLLRWDEETMHDQPANVKIKKWFPQQAILAHPNTKAFISHGGLLSTIEAVHFGVPMIGIPMVLDQRTNIDYAVNNGYAIALQHEELTEESLSKALDEILNNRTYQNNAKLRSKLMQDRVVPPLDEAVYWIEHVIRQNGSSHLRNAGMDLKWYQRENIDIAVLLILLVCAIFLCIQLIIRTLLNVRIISESTNLLKKRQ